MLKHWILGVVLALAPVSAWATCADLAQNGDETDVDCGGSCSPCADGLHCAIGADCISGSCTATVCDATATTTTTTTSTTTTTYPPAPGGSIYYMPVRDFSPAGGYAYDTENMTFVDAGAYLFAADVNSSKLLHVDFQNSGDHEVTLQLLGADRLDNGMSYAIYTGVVAASSTYHYEASAYYRYYGVLITDGVGMGTGRLVVTGK